MSRRHRQLRVRDPDVFLFPPATPLAHRHAGILRTIPVDHTISCFRYPDLHRGLLDLGGVPQRKLIVSIATSADGYVARPDGNLNWLTERPAPKGFYGLPEFERPPMPRSSAVRPLTGVCRWARASVRLPWTMCSLAARRLLPRPPASTSSPSRSVSSPNASARKLVRTSG